MAFGRQLGSILGGFWLRGWFQNRAKVDQKSIQNVISLLIVFWIDFWSDLVPTWSQLGSQNHPKMEPSWLQKPSKRQSSEITKTLKNHWFFKLFGGFGVPSWSQNRSKTCSKRYLKQDRILNGFWMALGSMLGPFWRPSWDQVGSKIGPKGG